MANLGYATIQVIPSMQGAAGLLSQGLGGPAAAAGTQAGRTAGAAMAGGISSALTGAGAALTLGATAPFAAALNVAGDFESAMNRVAAITQASSSEMGALQQAAITAGAESIFTATESANALYELGAAGFSVNESMQALPGVLQLASAGQLQIADAAVIASQVLHGYGLEVGDLGRVNDVLAQASVDSTASVSSLGTAFTYVGPLAALAGTSFEESAAALALLSNNGFDGTMAGTALRGVIESLINPTEQQSRRLRELGVSVLDASGNMRPLNEIVAQFAEAGADASDIMAIFGQRAGPAFAALLGEGSQALIDETNALLAADGAAQTMSDTMLQGLNPALERVQGAFQSLAIAVMDAGVLDAITWLVDRFADFVSVLVTLPRPALAAIGVIGGLAAAAGPLLLVTGLLVRQWTALRPALTILGSALSGISAPIVAAVAVVVALASSFYLAYRRSAEMRENLARIADVVGPPLAALGGVIRDGLGAALEFLGGEGNSLLEQFLDVNARVWVSITDFVADFVERTAEAFGRFREYASAFGSISGISLVIGDIFQLDPAQTGRVRQALQAIVDVSLEVRDVAVEVFGWLQTNVPPALAAVRDASVDAWGWIEEHVPPVLARIRDVSIEVWGWLAANVPPALAVVRDAAMASFGWLEEHVPPVLGAIRDGAVTSFGWLRDNVPPALAAVRDAAVGAFGWIEENVLPVMGALLRGAGRLVDWFREHWQTIAVIVVGTFAPVLAAIAVAVTQFGSVREAAGSALGGFVDIVGAAISGIRPIVTDFIDWWRDNWDNIRGTVERIMAVVATFRAAIVAAFTAVVVAVSAVWNRFGDTIIGAIVDTVQYVTRTLRNAFRIIEGIVGTFLALINGDWSGVWRNLGLIVRGVWDQLVNTVRLGWENIKTLLSLGLDALGALWDIAWAGVRNAVSWAIDTAVELLRAFPGRALEALGDLTSWLAEKGTALISGLYNAAETFVVDVVIPWYIGLPARLLEALGDLGRFLWDKGTDLLTGLYDAAEDVVVGTLLPMAAGLPRRVFDAIGDVARTLWDKGTALITGLWNAWSGFVNDTLIPGVAALPGRIGEALGDVGVWLVAKGRGLLNGLWDGARAVAEDIVDWAGELPGRIASAITGVLGALYNAGRAIVEKIAEGIRSLPNAISGAIRSIIPNSVAGIPIPSISVPGFASGTAFAPGGLALVGEEGPELVNLPRGSAVASAPRTHAALSDLAGRAGPTSVRVFIGDRELTDIVRVEVDEHERGAMAAVGAGVRW